MTLNLITLATVKTQRGITSSTYDTALTNLLPVVSADVRRILNDRFDVYVPATIVAGSSTMTWALDGPNGGWSCGSRNMLMLGRVLDSPGLPADTYVQSYDPTTGIHTLSANATASATYAYPTVSISQWPAIAKMLWYRYTTQNTSSVDVKGVQSESFGPVSVTYTDKEINKQYNYPYVILADLGKAKAGVA